MNYAPYVQLCVICFFVVFSSSPVFSSSAPVIITREMAKAPGAGEAVSEEKVKMEVSEMISALAEQKYRVVTEDEYRELVEYKLPFRPAAELASTPKPKLVGRMGRGRARSRASISLDLGKQEPEASVSMSRTGLVNHSQFDSNLVRIPKVPIFSGQEQKGDVSFNVWRYEVRCLMKDISLPETVLLQAVRQSLKGTAREMLIPLGENATARDILRKLDGLYGNVESDEATLQKFYTEAQQDGESVTAYACRLETLLHASIDSGYIDGIAKETMLRSKFWTSLNERLKTQTRHKYESIKSFDLLVREIRAIELELSNADKVKSSAKKGQHQPIQAEQTDNKLDQMVTQLAALSEKMKSLESKVDQFRKGDNTTKNFQNSRFSKQSQTKGQEEKPGKGKQDGNKASQRQQPKD